MRTNPIALASGVLPEFGPLDIIAAARAADFDAVGLWVGLAEWTGATTRDAKAALAQNGLDLINVEVVRIKPESLVDDHKRTLDIGAELGAKNLLCVSSDPDLAATAAKLAALCEHSPGVQVALEFGIFTEVRNLAMARSVIDAVNHPLAAILIDPIHVDRSNTAIAEIATLPPHLLPYAQFCDAPTERPKPNDFDAIITDAINVRMQCGTGALPLAAMLDAIPPDIPLSIEMRSKVLRDNFPDPADRARDVARAWLAL
ncbi:sugar phosphate isomerase/epimerase family protein [Sphingomonas sp.]|uniref:sugar phosphate isomerase/epimerase family protein n=1 Tax=Sphingomonas sp. TaxID=28214 RepID=UPI003752DABE